MKSLAALLLLLLFYPPPARAQSGPAQGDHELELWTGGGHSVNAGVGGISAWNVGLRYGWILTGLHGPGILRGQFEYAVDVVPVFWVFEPKGTAYGFVLDPIALKWDFQEHGRVVPYLELSGGTLFTSRDVPPGISKVNFASGGAAGLYFLTRNYGWSVELRYTHISDAGLTTPNPGVNTIQVRLGFSAFRHRKSAGHK
ncbi:MAG: acyloxyacyl hydrolase [Candidatus Acidiferrales bacterium]